MAGRQVSDAQLADALRKHAGIKARAAKAVGLDRSSVQERVERSPLLQQAIKDGEEKLLDIAESQLTKSVSRGDKDMVRYYLDRKGRKRGYGANVSVGLDEQAGAAIVAALGGSVEAYRAALARLGVAASEIP